MNAEEKVKAVWQILIDTNTALREVDVNDELARLKKYFEAHLKINAIVFPEYHRKKKSIEKSKCQLCNKPIESDTFKIEIGDVVDKLLDLEVCMKCAALVSENIEAEYL